MKQIIYGISFLTLIGIGVSSCQKAEVLKEKDNSLNNSKTILQNENSKEPVFEYYLDKKQVSKSKINFDDANLFISITKDVKNDNEIIIVDAFTMREDYILYGFTSLYDKSFYRKRMATIWGWGMQRVLLFWGYLYNANDRTSSVITG